MFPSMEAATHIEDAALATPSQTRAELVRQSKRKRHVGLRHTFVQAKAKGPGPLAGFVKATDLHGLRLYLLVLLKASSKPWNVALSASAWARALGFVSPTGKTARARVSRIIARLVGRKLVRRERYRRRSNITLLREDGSGSEYSELGSKGDRYLRIPTALWLQGPEVGGDEWSEVLTLPELAMLLIALSNKPDFALPYERVPEWYGLSADTAERGLRGLCSHGLLNKRSHTRVTPLSPTGFTIENRYSVVRDSLRSPPVLEVSAT